MPASRQKREVNLPPFPRPSLYESERSPQVREPALTIARIARELRHDAEPRHALDATLRELLALFGARTVLLVARDQSNGRVYRRDLRSADHEPTISDAELAPADELTYLFPTPAEAWYAVEREGWSRPLRCRWPDSTIAVLVRRRSASGAGRGPSLSFAAVPWADSGGAWVNRLRPSTPVGAGPRPADDRERDWPGDHNVELRPVAFAWRRRAGLPRARSSRRSPQSPIGPRCRMWRRAAAADRWRREARTSRTRCARKCRARDLIQRVAGVDDPRHAIIRVARRLTQYDSGITGISFRRSTTDVVPAVPRGSGPYRPGSAGERESTAAHANARPGLRHWRRVEVRDDGRGFEFAGRRSQAELDLERKGPVVIKERVRSIGGRLTVQSDPGQGSRVEVWLPRRIDG